MPVNQDIYISQENTYWAVQGIIFLKCARDDMKIWTNEFFIHTQFQKGTKNKNLYMVYIFIFYFCNLK